MESCTKCENAKAINVARRLATAQGPKRPQNSVAWRLATVFFNHFFRREAPRDEACFKDFCFSGDFKNVRESTRIR